MFALSVEPLPAPLRDTTTVAYLMFRVADFLEDNTVMAPKHKFELLNLWINMLGGEAGPEALAEHLADVDPGDPEAAVTKQARCWPICENCHQSFRNSSLLRRENRQRRWRIGRLAARWLLMKMTSTLLPLHRH
ncbi:MAG: hypothetical protein JXB30_18030 [Anaerolineae bacterium]|nr:hypothetical protein [Anaerolineae bacterium]